MTHDEESVISKIIPEGVDISAMQLDAVGEIENISMGSAATAVSNLLNAKVWITTPKVKILKIKDIAYPALEPSVQVKIDYIKGVKGTNTMILKQSDVQLMLNQLMGLPPVVTEDFVFDEMNISAVCEVMNQMMGASATALSEFLGVAIDISTPKAYVSEASSDYHMDTNPDDYVAAITFDLTIDDLINSEFVSLINIDLARELAERMLNEFNSGADEEVTNTIDSNPTPDPIPKPTAQAPVNPQPIPSPQPVYQNQGPVYEQPQYQQPVYQQPVYQQPVNVQNVKLHQFESFDSPVLTGEQQDNLSLLMNVPLNVTVEIGSASRKVKEILEFTQGTIIELERQAGAPVDIIVNGHLIARGDVVVIDDNFAVRITEIVKSKLLDSLGNKE